MAAPLAIAGLASLASSGIKLGQGISQRRKARKLEEQLKERFGEEGPISETPQAIQDATARSQALAGAQKAPGQAQAEMALRTSTGGAIGRARKAAPSASSLLSTIASVQGAEQRGMVALEGKAQQFRAAQEANVQRALAREGTYQDQNFVRNQLQPYQTALGEVSALRGAGRTNITNAATGALGTAASFATAGGFGGNGGNDLASVDPGFNTQGAVDAYNANTINIDPAQAAPTVIDPLTGQGQEATNLTGGFKFNY